MYRFCWIVYVSVHDIQDTQYMKFSFIVFRTLFVSISDQINTFVHFIEFPIISNVRVSRFSVVFREDYYRLHFSNYLYSIILVHNISEMYRVVVIYEDNCSNELFPAYLQNMNENSCLVSNWKCLALFVWED